MSIIDPKKVIIRKINAMKKIIDIQLKQTENNIIYLKN